MANYNTFAVIESKSGKILLITSSARKAKDALVVGKRIEVWNSNQKAQVITSRVKQLIYPYIEQERQYISQKQQRAELKNKKSKARL